MSDLDLTGRRYRCPDCKSWQLSRRRKLGLIRCLSCGEGFDAQDVLDTERDAAAVTNLDDNDRRKDGGPTIGLAAELAAIGEERDA